MASSTQTTGVWVSSGVGDGQGGLACCSPSGSKGLDWLSGWTELMAVPQNVKRDDTIWPDNSTCSQEKWTFISTQKLHMNDQNNLILNSQVWMTHLPFYWWMIDKTWCIHTMEYFGHKKQWSNTENQLHFNKKMYKKEWNTDKQATTWVDFENMLSVRSQSPKITSGGLTATEHSISFRVMKMF